jgi:chemotaxis protein MotB
MKPSGSIIRWTLAAFVALSMTSCISKKKHEEALTRAAAEKSALESQIQAAQAENDKLQGQISSLESNLNMKSDEIMKLSEQIKQGNQQIEALKSAIRETFSTYNANDIQVEERNGKLYITMANKILFDPGQAKLAKASDSLLMKFAQVINRNPNLSLLVEGHTDNDPVKIHKSQYPDNWSLSVARSLAVVRSLEKAGVDPKRLTASGKGETQPIADNATDEGKEKNRRTEFIVMPKIDGLYRMNQSNFSGSSMK